jgi:hypothetical protein
MTYLNGIISNEDALMRAETIVNRMNLLFRTADTQSRDWTEEFDLMAKHLKAWTRYMSNAAKTDWRIHTAELAIQYGYPTEPKTPNKKVAPLWTVDDSGDDTYIIE